MESTIKTFFRNFHPCGIQVEYSTRFVLGMFFNEPVDLGVDWSASYIGNHPILRFVSIDNLKRGLGDQSPTSVMI